MVSPFNLENKGCVGEWTKNTKVRCELADKSIPFLWGYIKKHPKFQIPRWPGSAASRLAI